MFFQPHGVEYFRCELHVKTDMWILFPCHQTWAIYKESKEIILSLEQCKLLRVFDAVSLQCFWLVTKETICSQGWNKVHDKVAYRYMAWMYNLCRILQHVVNGFDNVSLAQHHSVIECTPSPTICLVNHRIKVCVFLCFFRLWARAVHK